MRERIYVCHTFYNVYITLLKEFTLGEAGAQGQADIALSTISSEIGRAHV